MNAIYAYPGSTRKKSSINGNLFVDIDTSVDMKGNNLSDKISSIY